MGQAFLKYREFKEIQVKVNQRNYFSQLLAACWPCSKPDFICCSFFRLIVFCFKISAWNQNNSSLTGTRFIVYKNHVYKNVEAQKYPFFKNIVVILLVAISISFEPQDEI